MSRSRAMLSEPLQLVAQSLSDHRGALKGFNLAQRALRFGRTLGCEPHGGIGSDTPALKNDVTNARRAQVQSLGKRVCAQAQGLQVLLTKHFAGVNRPHSVFESHVILPLMRNGW
jgi:hypothetical protein